MPFLALLLPFLISGPNLGGGSTVGSPQNYFMPPLLKGVR